VPLPCDPTDSSSCPSGETCDSTTNTCQPVSGCGMCNDDCTCPNGLTCDNQTVCTGCDPLLDQCPDGQTCVLNICMTP
jgi:hypothetical protein